MMGAWQGQSLRRAQPVLLPIFKGHLCSSPPSKGTSESKRDNTLEEGGCRHCTVQLRSRDLKLGFNPTLTSVGFAASQTSYALGAPCVKAGNRAPLAAAGLMREPKPSRQEPTLPHTLTNRLVLLPEGELRKA